MGRLAPARRASMLATAEGSRSAGTQVSPGKAAAKATALPPGTVMPRASAMQAMVLAVPITLQVPTLATSWLLTAAISCASISSARNLPQ